ncbi:MAG TPA: WD40 repeat domain-containing protein, partial [Pyrinomonadaceae bacterium]|nr:WD40 repeat domain-containing protein [Pyrinomonadaceae bacterium]
GQTIGYVWDFESGPISSLPIYYKGSPHLVFKPDDLLSVGVDLSGKVSIGQATRAGFDETIRDNAPEMSVGASALAPAGQMLAVADVNKRTIRLWDLQQRKLARTLAGHTSVITSLAFSPDGQQLASASWDKTIKLWDTRTGQLLRTLEGHTSSVTALAFSPDGKTLVSGSADYLVDRDHSIKLWDVQSGQLLRTLEGHATGVTLLCVSPDGKSLASTGRGGEIRLWDLSSGALRHTVAATGVDTSALVFHPSGRFLITGSADATIKILSPADGTLIATIIAFNDGNWLITSPAGLFDGSAAAWERILWRFSPALRDVAPVEIFFNEFYYPDLLADLLAGREPKVTPEIAQKDRRQPRLKLALADGQQPTGDITTRNVKVQIEVTDTEAGAQDVRLFRNGALVHVWRGDVLQGQTTARLEATLPIVVGENRLTAYGFNHDNVKSSDATLIIQGAKTLKREAIAY